MNKNHSFSDLHLSFFVFSVFRAFFLNNFLRIVYWIVFREAFWAIVFRAILIERDDEERFICLTILIIFFRAILIEEDAEKFIFLTNLRSICLDVMFEMRFCDAMKVLRCDESFEWERICIFIATFQFWKRLYKLFIFQFLLSHMFHYERKLWKRFFEISISISI